MGAATIKMSCNLTTDGANGLIILIPTANLQA
jgi:hypothetical protein